MAERRMFAKTIIDSDAFLDMPLSTQALYFHLSIRADDDGFVNNPKKVQRMIGCSDDDLKLLIAKSFILTFESGVIVIKHWKIHNYIRNDRYKPTVYEEEKAMLQTKENSAYTLGIPSDNQMDTNGIPTVDEAETLGIQEVSKMDTQVRLVKDSLVKDRLGEVRIGQDSLITTEQQPNLSTGEKVNALIKKYWGRELAFDDAVHYLKRVLTDGAEDPKKMQMFDIALKLSGQQGEKACNWRYVDAIYTKWEQNNITTPEEWAAYEQKRKGGAR